MAKQVCPIAGIAEEEEDVARLHARVAVLEAQLAEKNRELVEKDETIENLKEYYQTETTRLHQIHQQEMQTFRALARDNMNESAKEAIRARVNAAREIREAKKEMERQLEEILEVREDLQAEIDIPKFKSPVDETYHVVDFEDCVESHEPTNEFVMVPENDIKLQFSSMSTMIDQLRELIHRQQEELNERAFRVMSIQPEEAKKAPEEQKAVSQKDMEEANEMCREMDVKFLESLL